MTYKVYKRKPQLYEFNCYGTLWHHDSNIAVYLNGERVSPHPRVVLWFPWNWVIITLALPFAIARAIKHKRRYGRF